MIMDPYLYILVQIIFVIAGLTILFLLAIVLLRLFHSLGEKRYRQMTEDWEDVFFGYLQGELTLEEAAAVFKKANSYPWMWRFLAPYIRSLDGDDFDQAKLLCRQAGLIDYYKKRLHHRSVTQKALAARTLGSLRCRESTSDLLAMLHSKNPIFILAAAQGLAASGDTSAFAQTTRTLLNHTFFTFEGAAEILSRFGVESCKAITAALEAKTGSGTAENPVEKSLLDHLHGKDSIEPYVYYSLYIDLLGNFRYREALPALGKLARFADQETMVHILKAFLRIGEMPPGFDIKPFLKHDYWVVRSFAAQVWKYSRDQEALPLLENLLSDPYWWVRYHAARALSEAGQNGKTLLKRKTTESAGAAADISRYILELNEVN